VAMRMDRHFCGSVLESKCVRFVRE
jgi:hypothetical protein